MYFWIHAYVLPAVLCTLMACLQHVLGSALAYRDMSGQVHTR
jgi:hypothetical protein